jgi:DNA-binding NarL/FixJ family response regulator
MKMEPMNSPGDEAAAEAGAGRALDGAATPCNVQGTRVVLWVAAGGSLDVTRLAQQLVEASHGAASVTLVSVEEVSASAAAHAMPVDDASACGLICGHAAQCHGEHGDRIAVAARTSATARADAVARRQHAQRRAERHARGVATSCRGRAPERRQAASSAVPAGAGAGCAAAGIGAPIAVMLASGRQALLDSLLPRLASEPDIELLGDPVADPARLLTSLRQRLPALLLLDKPMFDRLGPASVRAIHAKHPGLRVLLLCDEAGAGLVEAVLRHRFHGFLLTRCSPAASAKAIRAVSRGELWLPRTMLASAVFDPLQAPAQGELTPHDDRPLNEAKDALTPREAQVVAQLRQGFTNKEIARRLGVMEDTVKKHLQSVFAKLGVHRRALVVLRPTQGQPNIA